VSATVLASEKIADIEKHKKDEFKKSKHQILDTIFCFSIVPFFEGQLLSKFPESKV
jgi:hypothetical protein